MRRLLTDAPDTSGQTPARVCRPLNESRWYPSRQVFHQFIFRKNHGAQQEVKKVMRARVVRAEQMQCDGIEPDNMNGEIVTDCSYNATKVCPAPHVFNES